MTPCGGCDTLPTYDKIFELAKRFSKEGKDVLFEGLLISGDVIHFVDLHEHCKKHKG